MTKPSFQSWKVRSVKVSHRYSPLTKALKKIYRKFMPVPVSPWTAGAVADICSVNLVPPQKLTGFFEDCITRLRRIKGDDIGDYLEFGVFNGNSIGSMYRACKNLGVADIRLFGFDAFEGLPPGSENEDGGVWKKGFYLCSFPQMQECLRRRNVNPDEIIWVKGWYADTLNVQTLATFNLRNIALVFVDCDTYRSSKTVLDFLTPLIQSPLIICFDDWKLNDLDIKGMGEYRAFNEFLESNPRLKIREIKSYNRKSKSFLILPAR